MFEGSLTCTQGLKLQPVGLDFLLHGIEICSRRGSNQSISHSWTGYVMVTPLFAVSAAVHDHDDKRRCAALRCVALRLLARDHGCGKFLGTSLRLPKVGDAMQDTSAYMRCNHGESSDNGAV
jgi:hypothetical protein